jgi:hypothetical protein
MESKTFVFESDKRKELREFVEQTKENAGIVSANTTAPEIARLKMLLLRQIPESGFLTGVL